MKYFLTKYKWQKDTASMCMGHSAGSLTNADQSLLRNKWNTYQLNCNSATSCEPQPTARLTLDPGELKHSTARLLNDDDDELI